MFRPLGIFLSTLFILSFAPVPVFSETLDNRPEAVNLRERMTELLSRTCFQKAKVGVKFISLDHDTLLFSKNSSDLLTPASNMKMVTTATALKELGPVYHFPTRIYTNGIIKNRVVKGDLYLKGFGDPYLVTEQMWVLVNELRHLPIDRVEGKVYVDETFFDGVHSVPTWKGYSGPEAYLAPLGALSFNFNTVAVHVAPGKRAGDAPIVVVEPKTPYTRLTNSAKTSRSSRRGRIIVNRHRREGYDEITVSGAIPKNVGRKTYYLNITDPAWYAGHVFMKNLRQVGISVKGKLHRGRVPNNAQMILEHESVPLADILKGLNKYSNNFMAEQILKTLGAERKGPPGTTENGAEFLNLYMQSLGWAKDSFNIVDGSGLSRQNRLSPDQLVSVLKDMWKHLEIFPEFISALAVMGQDGSVTERMTQVNGAQTIRAKTGTLNHVSALSGYFQTQAGERMAFSILLNGLKCSTSQAQRLQDKILYEALRFGSAPSKN